MPVHTFPKNLNFNYGLGAGALPSGVNLGRT